MVIKWQNAWIIIIVIAIKLIEKCWAEIWAWNWVTYSIRCAFVVCHINRRHVWWTWTASEWAEDKSVGDVIYEFKWEYHRRDNTLNGIHILMQSEFRKSCFISMHNWNVQKSKYTKHFAQLFGLLVLGILFCL